jgi:hypothetical protein
MGKLDQSSLQYLLADDREQQALLSDGFGTVMQPTKPTSDKETQ